MDGLYIIDTSPLWQALSSLFCFISTIMITFLSPDFLLQDVTRDDLTIASLCWG